MRRKEKRQRGWVPLDPGDGPSRQGLQLESVDHAGPRSNLGSIYLYQELCPLQVSIACYPRVGSCPVAWVAHYGRV